MAESIQLSLRRPVSLASDGNGIWVADRASHSVVRFDAETAKPQLRIALPGEPVALGAATDFVAAFLASGSVLAFDARTGKSLWQREGSFSNIVVKSTAATVCMSEPAGTGIRAFDRSGFTLRTPLTSPLTDFQPSGDEVFWIQSGTSIGVTRRATYESFTANLPAGQSPTALAACANALWISVPAGLLLVDRQSLQVRATVATPEASVRHLICGDGKIIGGERGLYVLNPADDAGARDLRVEAQSPFLGIAATSTKIWALESGRPVVHIADLL